MRGQLKRKDYRHTFGVTEVDSNCSVGTGHHEMRLCVMQSHGPQFSFMHKGKIGVKFFFVS